MAWYGQIMVDDTAGYKHDINYGPCMVCYHDHRYGQSWLVMVQALLVVGADGSAESAGRNWTLSGRSSLNWLLI